VAALFVGKDWIEGLARGRAEKAVLIVVERVSREVERPEHLKK
jgi:hypothetical protein